MTSEDKLVLQTNAAGVPRAEALLEIAGAESISLRDAADAPLFEPEPGATPLWADVEIHALFEPGSDLPRIAAWLRQALAETAAVRVEPRAEAGGVGKSPIRPREIGRRLLVLPADSSADPGDRVAIRLHMGLGFGTGEHPTTRMCLEWLERELEPGARVVDYGCGSGVLAVAALGLGAQAAWAVDVDPQALQATAANAALNGCASRLWIGKPDELAARACDVVVANILAIPLIGLADTFVRLLAPDGRVVLTGILEPQAEGVISAYAPRFGGLERRSSEGWSLLTARLKAPFAQEPD